MARRTRPELSGIFDFLKPKAGPTGLPALQKEETQLPARYEEPAQKKSMFAVFAPKPEKAQKAMVPVEPKEPAAPSKPFWEMMFRPSQEAQKPQKPQASMFEFMAPAEPEPVQEYPRYQFVQGPKKLPYGSPSAWEVPFPNAMAERLANRLDLDAIFNHLEETRQTDEYQDNLADYSYRGLPLYTPIDIIDDKNLYTDFADFYGIPWSVVEEYANHPDGERLFREEVLGPLHMVLTEAFEGLKPLGLPGFFMIEKNETLGKHWLYYVEPWLGRLPGI